MASPLFNTEADMMRSLQSGSHAAFTEVYQKLHQRLYFFALRFVSEKDAEDITADSFITLWSKKIFLATLDEVSAYLHVLVRNRCYNQLRDKQLRDDKQEELLHLLETQGVDDHLLEQVRIELIELIYRQIEQLPAKMKEIFLLSYRDGLKPAQIAEYLDISVQTVSNQKLSAIKILKAVLSRQNKLGILLLLCELKQGFSVS